MSLSSLKSNDNCHTIKSLATVERFASDKDGRYEAIIIVQSSLMQVFLMSLSSYQRFSTPNPG
jgi:hypothetical protein